MGRRRREETEGERFYYGLRALLVSRRAVLLPWDAPPPQNKREADRVIGWLHPEGEGAYLLPILARAAVEGLIERLPVTDRALAGQLQDLGCIASTDEGDPIGRTLTVKLPTGVRSEVWHITQEALTGDI